MPYTLNIMNKISKPINVKDINIGCIVKIVSQNVNNFYINEGFVVLNSISSFSIWWYKHKLPTHGFNKSDLTHDFYHYYDV